MRPYRFKNPKYNHVFKSVYGEVFTVPSVTKDPRYSEYKLCKELDYKPSELDFVGIAVIG